MRSLNLLNHDSGSVSLFGLDHRCKTNETSSRRVQGSRIVLSVVVEASDTFFELDRARGSPQLGVSRVNLNGEGELRRSVPSELEWREGASLGKVPGDVLIGEKESPLGVS